MGEAVRTSVKAPETKKENQVSQVQKGNFYQPFSSPVEQILFLQRTIGNQAVQRLMKSGALQAKLRISAPGDVYEQEADRVADAVMRMPQPQAVSSGIPSIQRACQKCESGSISEVNPDLEINIQSLKGGGKPLSENERAFFEPRFGHDFCDVRIHADTRAANVARSVRARAFTLGRSIAFGEHEYAPDSFDGRRLLAHELTHVIQQGGAGTIRRQAAPDAGTPAPCPVTPITPITDPDALAMEGGTRVIWNNTAANLQTCANNLVGLIQGAGGTAGITSAYRPQAYQDHLREVWDKARALQSHPETACNTVRAAVNAEMANHSLNVNRAVAQISNHRAGNAVDIGWTLPAALTNAICQMPVPDGGSPVSPTEEQCIDSLAGRAGMSHPLHAGDRPHFEI